MSMNITLIREIIVATVSNPNFFFPGAPSDDKIKQVSDLMKQTYETVKNSD